MDTPLTFINGRITDSVTQSDTLVVAQSPAMALGSLYQNLAQATALASMNAVYAQQQSNIAFQSATVRAVQTLLGHP
jgi:myosin-crossreactive antigen